jgi:antitoxin MazE
MQAHIQKWGNSLGLRIPMQVAKQLKLHPGSSVTIEIENGRIIIQSPKYDLDMMLKDITPKNQHHQILDDEQLHGNEEW